MGELKIAGYLTLEQASQYLNIPERTLRRKSDQKLVRCFKPGRSLLFKREDLDAFMNRFIK